jgi:DNA-binding FadR family transcriptional regulator
VSAPKFEVAARRTVSEEVRESLLRDIRSGALIPGTQLPPERVLCDQFAVARTSVREAIQGLVSLGHIERRGNRLYVTEPLTDVRFDQRKQSVEHMFEFRRLVEVSMAELTATRADRDERRQITELARSFSVDMDLDEFRKADREFHESIARSCHNPVLADIYGKVLDTLFKSSDFESLLTAQHNATVVRRVIRDACRSHRRIADAIQRRDPEAVRAAVEAHLRDVEAKMLMGMT